MTLGTSLFPASASALALATALAAAPDGLAQSPIRVLFLGGGPTTSHDPGAMRAVMEPVLEQAGMQVDYRTNESVLKADSLARYDVLFVYNSKKGMAADGTPDLTEAQEDALYAWVEAGHGMVAVHSASSSYLGDPRWAELIGASYKEHGDDLVSIAVSQPVHGSMTGVSPPTGWDEGRVHTLLKQDLTVVATANTGKTPWTWVRPQGKGWVYYTSSGHDTRVWSDTNFQGQMVQAVRWAHSASRPATALAPGAPAQADLRWAPERGRDALGRDLAGEAKGKSPRTRFYGLTGAAGPY